MKWLFGKKKYPLPLLDAAFESLQWACIFQQTETLERIPLTSNPPEEQVEECIQHPSEALSIPLLYSRQSSTLCSRACWKSFSLSFLMIFLEMKQGKHVCPVLRLLLENRPYVKVEKCQFHALSVFFLDFIVKWGQLSPDLLKVQAVVKWLTPSPRKQLQPIPVVRQFLPLLIRDIRAGWHLHSRGLPSQFCLFPGQRKRRLTPPQRKQPPNTTFSPETQRFLSGTTCLSWHVILE